MTADYINDLIDSIYQVFNSQGTITIETLTNEYPQYSTEQIEIILAKILAEMTETMDILEWLRSLYSRTKDKEILKAIEQKKIKDFLVLLMAIIDAWLISPTKDYDPDNGFNYN